MFHQCESSETGGEGKARKFPLTRDTHAFPLEHSSDHKRITPDHFGLEHPTNPPLHPSILEPPSNPGCTSITSSTPKLACKSANQPPYLPTSLPPSIPLLFLPLDHPSNQSLLPLKKGKKKKKKGRHEIENQTPRKPPQSSRDWGFTLTLLLAPSRYPVSFSVKRKQQPIRPSFATT